MPKKVETVEVTDEGADAPEELILVAAEVTPDEIAVRAYHIHLSGSGGDELENWVRAERELEAERGAAGEDEGDTGSE
jgi:hypothetical protein